jgi:probable addiction module antidote protein
MQTEKPLRKRIKVDELPTYDAANHLHNERTITAFLTDVLKANDPGLLASALGDFARARGMTEMRAPRGSRGRAAGR